MKDQQIIKEEIGKKFIKLLPDYKVVISNGFKCFDIDIINSSIELKLEFTITDKNTIINNKKLYMISVYNNGDVKSYNYLESNIDIGRIVKIIINDFLQIKHKN